MVTRSGKGGALHRWRGKAAIIVGWLVLFFAPTSLFAQTPPPEQRLLLLDERELFGRIVQEDNINVWVQMASGMIIRVPKDQIRARFDYERPPFVPIVPFEDPSGSRMLFFPTAKPLQRGQGYVAVYEVFLPSVTVGITNRISITGGSTLIPNAQSQVAYVAPNLDEATFLSTRDC